MTIAAHDVDVDAVTQLIAQVARDAIMPKFQRLRDDEVHHKATAGHVDDIVTVADRDAEAQLTDGLISLMPSACVVAEEASHGDPALIELVNGDRPVWIIDPLDGTSNFAAGLDAFGTMVGLALGGDMQFAWIHLPARQEMWVAGSGAGTFLNGARNRVPPSENPTPRGALFMRYMPAETGEHVLASTSGRIIAMKHTGAAAVEYTDVARGRQEFAIYYRLLPWDHGAPALVLRESGGAVEHMDGRPYTVRSTNQITLVGRDREIVERLRGWLRQ